MTFTFSKKEKLKSQKLIEHLFSQGKTVVAYPLRLVYIETTFGDDVRAKVGVSVSKRHFKHAVNRNRIKRLMREVYRLNKGDYFNNSSTQYALMILYIGKDGTDFETINSKMRLLFDKFIKETTLD